MTMDLVRAAIRRKRERAYWCASMKRKRKLKNLQTGLQTVSMKKKRKRKLKNLQTGSQTVHVTNKIKRKTLHTTVQTVGILLLMLCAGDRLCQMRWQMRWQNHLYSDNVECYKAWRCV